MTATIGTPMLRKEDPKLLTGENKFVDDIRAPGELWMGMVRCTSAHAKITSIDTSGAEEMHGVHSVYTGAQLADMGLWIAHFRAHGPSPTTWPTHPIGR